MDGQDRRKDKLSYFRHIIQNPIFVEKNIKCWERVEEKRRREWLVATWIDH